MGTVPATDNTSIGTGPGGIQPLARRMYTVAEAATILGIGRSTAYELVLRGELDSVRIGRRALITAGALEEIIGEKPPPPGCSFTSQS